MIPQEDQYLSCLMGAPTVSDDDLSTLGITIVEAKEGGSRWMVIPTSVLPGYTRLIRARLESGFWNEIVGRDRIVFFYQLAGGSFVKLTYSEATNGEIARLCSKLNDDPIELTSDIPRYLAGNPFYTDLMVAHHGASAT